MVNQPARLIMGENLRKIYKEKLFLYIPINVLTIVQAIGNTLGARTMNTRPNVSEYELF